MRIIIFLSCFLTILSANYLTLKPGESKVFSTKEKITTVFASEPKVLDYQVINSTTLAVFSKTNGYAEIKAFGEKGNNVILNISANIDTESPNLAKIAKLIERQNPDSKIKLEKLSIEENGNSSSKKGYIISGVVPNLESRDKAYLTAATALGLNIKSDKIKRQNISKTSNTGVDISRDGSENLDFLEKITIDGLVDDLEVLAPKQVNVKLIIADVEKSIVEKLGIDFNNGHFEIPITNSKIHSLPLNLKTIGITSIIDAIKDENVARILAQPNISVISGESATFQVTSQYTPTGMTIASNGVTEINPQTPIDYGISLTVQPKVYSKDRIVLNIAQEVSDIASVVEGKTTSTANIKKRRTQSVVELADGDSFILGGLIDERDIENLRGITGLGDIPILGGVFKKNSKTRSKTELLVVMTINLTKPVTQEYIQVPNIHKKTLFGSLFNIDNIQNIALKEAETANFISNIDFIK